ncbi:hypothetical protein AB5N19_08975 [Seiridium cardinale]
MASDPFEDVLNLEDQYYDQGYHQGYEDGYKAGKIEGRSVGLKTGFEKFIEAGRLQGKAIVWANRMPNLRQVTGLESKADSRGSRSAAEPTGPKLPPLSSNARLEKNVCSMHALVELGTLSTENNDEAVNDFDDRVKRAQGKLKIIERMIGEDADKGVSNASPIPGRNEI